MSEDKKIIDKGLRFINILVKNLANDLKTSPELQRTQKRINLAIQYDPLTSFNTVGRFLFKYKDLVHSELSDDNDILVRDFPEVYNSNTDIDANLLIMAELKLLYKDSDKQTRKDYRDLLVNILDLYLDYLHYIAQNS